MRVLQDTRFQTCHFITEGILRGVVFTAAGISVLYGVTVDVQSYRAVEQQTI